MIELLSRALAPIAESIYPSVHRLAPRFFGALLLIVLAWAVAGSARWAARRATRTQWLVRLLLRSGVLSGLVEPSLAQSRRAFANGIYWCVLLAGFGSVLALLSDRVAARLAELVLILLPNLLLGVVIILGTWWLGRYWGRSVLIWMTNEALPHPWRWAAAARTSIVFAGIALASELTGFGTALVRSSFLILLAGATFAIAHASLPLLRSHLASFSAPDETKQQSDDALLR